MSTKKIAELEQEIRVLESEKDYLNSFISLLMSEADMIDHEIAQKTCRGVEVNDKLRDLRAELKDTI